MKVRERVKGDRICRQCKGICHEGSWIIKKPERNLYFDSKFCLIHYLYNHYYKGEISFERLKDRIGDWVDENKGTMYEKVDVIAK